MAYSKIILNGETLMDVTGDTVDAGNLLDGETATKNSGAKVTGNIATKSSSDLTVSGATVTVPSGYYSASTSKSVASGTAGTPIATKGTVSNNSVSVTPSVTNTTGYITGGTKTGTAVSVSASELVSGTKNITSAGTWGVTNNAYVSVPSGNFTPSATKGTVSNNSVLVTPSATSTAGFVDAQTKTGTAVTVSASELVSGTKTIIANGTGIDVTNYASVDVNVSAPRTATILTDGIRDTRASLYCEVYYGGTHYYTKDDTFTFSAGGTLEILIQTYNSGTREVFEDGESIAVSSSTATSWRYDYTLPDYDVDITLKKEWSATYGSVEIRKSGGSSAVINPLSVTQNGTYTAPSGVDGYSPVTVNVSGGGGGGLEYETGTWTPSEDVAEYTIEFTNTHTTPPFFYMVYDATNQVTTTTYSNYVATFMSPYLLSGDTISASATNINYGYLATTRRATNSQSLSHANNALASSAISTFATNTGINAYSYSSSYYFRAGRPYKWIAVWPPTT